MDLVGSSVFCRGSCSLSKLLIFVSSQGCRSSELVPISQENLRAVEPWGLRPSHAQGLSTLGNRAGRQVLLGHFTDRQTKGK